MIGVAQRAPQIIGGGDFEIDGLADGPAQEILQRHDQLIDVDARRDQRLPPREGEQAMGERGGAVRRNHRGVDVAHGALGASLVETDLQQIERADDAGQQIVEVVRDAAGQLPDRLHLLRLPQGFFGGFQPLSGGLLRGHVAGDRVDVILVRHTGPGQPAVRSVLVPEAAFEPDREIALDQLAHFRPGQSAIVGMLQPFRGAVQQFGLAPAERLGPGRIDRSPDAVAIRDHQEVLRHVPDPVAFAGLFLDPPRQGGVELGELFGDARQFGLALPQDGGRKIILGHVPAHDQHATDAVVLVDRAEAVGPVDLFQPAMARHRNELVLMPGRAAAAHHLLDLGADNVPDFGPAFPAALTERARMTLGSHGLAVRVVIELDQFGPPPDEHRVIGVEQDSHRGAQALRPGLRRPQLTCGPVIGPHQRAHLAAAGEEIRKCPLVDFQHEGIGGQFSPDIAAGN